MLKFRKSINGTLYAHTDDFIFRVYRSNGRVKLSMVFKGPIEDEDDAKNLAEDIARTFGLIPD